MTNDKAKEVIATYGGLPGVVTEKFQHGEINYSRNFGGSNMSAENLLKERGLITFEFLGKKRDMFFQYNSYRLSFTSEGMKYVVGEDRDDEGRLFYVVQVADRVLVEIVSLTEINDGKACQVEYTWKFDGITPFGEAISLRNAQLNGSDNMMRGRPVYNSGQLFSVKVMMTRGEDGWKIQSES